ncbi:MAG TPA: HEAT repeat domain-containing protein [Polyangia bacterium]|nr:HEAT repeat domain-containing protein [Polyangia bacterium]
MSGLPTGKVFAAALVLAAGTSASGCRRNRAPTAPARPALGSVSFRDLTPPGNAPGELSLAPIEDAVRQRLLGTGMFAPSPASDAGSSGPVVRVRGEFAIDGAVVGSKAAARAVVRMRLDTRPSDVPGAIEEDLQGQGEQTYVIPSHDSHGEDKALAAQRELYSNLVIRLARDLVDGLAAPRKLREAAPEVVHAALAADGGELRAEAIRVAGQRQLRQEIPQLLVLLNDPDEATRDAALGALIAMKERRAVTELTKSRSLRDRREMRKILEAVSLLGGQEALDYLSFVAATHDEEEIRTEAAAAKARLERREAESGQTK